MLPFVGLYFAGRLLASRPYWSHFDERLGFIPRLFSRTRPGSIWLHAVSVGEVVSAIPLLKRLRSDEPQVPVYLSTSTVAGRKTALRNASDLVDGIFYAPVDYVSCVRRVIKRIRPALLIVLETEIWPNLYAEAASCGARIAICNGRISSRTWPRYRRWSYWFTPIAKLVDVFHVQSAVDRERFLHLGAPADLVHVSGNLKYDAALPSSTIDFDSFGARQIWIAASTVGPNERGSLHKHDVDEDDLVLAAFRQLSTSYPGVLLILAPRQPKRFDEVARQLQKQGVSFVRRSAAQSHPGQKLALPGVLLLDTIGELASLYARADVVFVGGSLAPRGGHNIIEPASAGAPIVVGPNMQNFEAIASDFLAAQAMIQIRNADELLPTVESLLRDRSVATRFGERARQLVMSQRGVSEKLAESLWPLYFSANLRQHHGVVSRTLLFWLSVVWKNGGFLKRHRSQQRAASLLPLPVPVVSVGGITVGGSGKTPFTTFLAQRLTARGFSPAILTRGYRRRSPAENMIFPPSAKVPTAFTGDEAQIFLRAGVAPIGIGAKRYETAKILLRQYPETDVLLLDDGFQHARLHRDVDVVLIDGLDPFGQDELVPLGRLREPLSALVRAHAFVVTRVENELRFQSICNRLSHYNPAAPVFRTRLIARSWRNYRTGERIPDLKNRTAAAFCGLGNPESFWRTLERLGIDVAYQWSFDDHHHYRPSELQRLALQARQHGADILVTTEKDRVNCPDNLQCAIAPLDLAWLEIDLELEKEAEFFEFLEHMLRRHQVVPVRR